MICNTIKLYENREDVTLTTYILDDSQEMMKGRNRPAMLICPGGAYLFCSDREGEPVALRFNAMGYHAFVLRYSVYYERQEPDFSEAEKRVVKPHCIHPNPVLEIAQAIMIIKEHAQEWHIDADKIALCGFSAGAHNCAMFSVYYNKPLVFEKFGKTPDFFKPALTILGYMLSDYHAMKKSCSTDEESKEFLAVSNLALLGDPDPNDEILTSISPALLVSKDTPPMFLWSTAADNLIPIEQTTRMATSLAQNGIPFELHVFEEGPHGLSLADQTSSADASLMDKDAKKWTGLVEEWLLKRFAYVK